MRWISIDDRLPELKGEVLIYCKREYSNKKEVIIGFLESYGFCSVRMREDEILTVTHWKPLPEPPKEI